MQDELENLIKNNLHDLDKNQMELKDFMTPEFISKHSNFIDVEHLFNESNFKVQSIKDTENIISDELNNFILNNTLFDSWEEMQKTAIELYIKK